MSGRRPTTRAERDERTRGQAKIRLNKYLRSLPDAGLQRFYTECKARGDAATSRAQQAGRLAMNLAVIEAARRLAARARIAACAPGPHVLNSTQVGSPL